MKLLLEAERTHFRNLLSRGEYCIDLPHVRIACPECGGQNKFHRERFKGGKGRFDCRYCGVEEDVKLTGERA